MTFTRKIKNRMCACVRTQCTKCSLIKQEFSRFYSKWEQKKWKWCACDLSFCGLYVCVCSFCSLFRLIRAHVRVHLNRSWDIEILAPFQLKSILRVFKQRPNFSESENYFKLASTTAATTLMRWTSIRRKKTYIIKKLKKAKQNRQKKIQWIFRDSLIQFK